MSDMETRGDGLLDRSLSSYYRELADAPVPVKLHGRTVRSLEARGESRGLRQALRPRRSWAVPVLLAGVLIAAVALVGLPWLNGSQANFGGPGISPTLAPIETRMTVMNLGDSMVVVELDGKTVGQLSCGQTGTYMVSKYPTTYKISNSDPSIGAANFATGENVASQSDTWTQAAGAQWWAFWPQRSFSGPNPPVPGTDYAFCPTKSQGTDPGGKATWDFEYPVISGTAHDRLVNQTISAAVDQWSIELARALIGDQTQQLTPGTGRITATYTTETEMAGMVSLSIRFDPTVSSDVHLITAVRQLTVDLTDGHVVGVDELFTNPTDGLAVLSAQSRSLLGMPADGGPFAAETAPDAANFASWFPTIEGLRLEFADPAATPAADAWPGQTGITIPWSELDGVLKADSPVRSVLVRPLPSQP